MSIAVSIIISSQNRAADLRATLASIAATRVRADMPTELLMIDNASADDTWEMMQGMRFDNMEYLPTRDMKPGKSGALNRAMARARGRVFLFTDDDVRVPADWIGPMCEPILSSELDGVIGGVKLAPHLERPWLKGFKRACMAVTDDYDTSATIMIGANMALGRHVFDRVGGLDTELGPGALVAGDDVLLSWQVHEAGFKVGTRLGTAIEHHPHESRLTRAAFLRRAQFEGRQEAYMFHHWLHGTMKMPWAKMKMRQARLAWKRMVAGSETRTAEGAPDWELRLISSIGLCDQYMKELKRPRNYAKRGLKKIAAAAGRSPAEMPPVLETV